MRKSRKYARIINYMCACGEISYYTIANNLNLTNHEARGALDNLASKEFVEYLGDKKWRLTKNFKRILEEEKLEKAEHLSTKGVYKTLGVHRLLIKKDFF